MGKKHWRCWTGKKIDLVVTDIAMPLMDGIELIREIGENIRTSM